MDKTDYWIDAASYLERAKRRLAEKTHEALFYAAYEVRCAVEARQDEYLKAQAEYAASIPKAWRIGDQGSELERIFASDKIQRVEWTQADAPPFVAYHVPVTQALRDRTQALNDLLHAQLRSRKFYDRWWEQSRKRVVEVYRRTWVTCQGKLLSPVMRHHEEDKLIGKVRMVIDNPDAQAFTKAHRPGARLMVHVSYPEEPPAEWVVDLDD